jgi:hypothetical protein
MTSIPLSDLFLIVFVLVDDWYQYTGKHERKGKPGAKRNTSPTFAPTSWHCFPSCWIRASTTGVPGT